MRDEWVGGASFTEPNRRKGDAIGRAVELRVWGGHFREDDDDELGCALDGLRQTNGRTLNREEIGCTI
jgi:hypothetical protein